jgi:hypothetical protein
VVIESISDLYKQLMSRKIAAITNASGVCTLYLGGAGAASSLTQAYQEVHLYQLVRLNRLDPRRIAIASDTQLTFSIDGGVTWNHELLPGTGTVKQLQWVDLTTLIITRTDTIFRSDLSGFSLFQPLIPDGGDDIVDSYWETQSKGWFMRNDPTRPDGHLHFTLDGVVWSTLHMSAITGWNLEEAPRRIAVWTGPGIVLLLTSHSVFSGTHADDFSSNTFARIWDYEPVVSAIPGMVFSGYNAGVDENTRFDDIKVFTPSGRIWLGGFQSLRAHSTGGAFFLTDIDSIVPDRHVYYRHSVTDPDRVFAGSSEDPLSLFPLRPGLNSSQNGGIDMAIYKNFPGEVLIDHDALFPADILGCSDPEACNFITEFEHEYVGLVVSDDGSCENAVQLIGCQTGLVLHTTSPEIVELSCELPSATITITSMTSDPDQHVEIDGVGLSNISYEGDFSIATSYTMLDRITAFIAELVASINASGEMRASNPSPGVITIFTLDPNYAEGAIVMSMIGVGYTNSPRFGTGTPGRVVRLEGQSECFYVCGRGRCSEALDYTLMESFDNCVFCDVRATGHICLNCTNVVSFNGVPIRTSDSFSDPECIGIQGTIDVRIRASIPVRSYPSVALNVAYTCGAGPVIFSVSGDHSEHYPSLSQLTTIPNGHVYTVASSYFDPNTGNTLITTVEACQGDEETSLIPFNPCSCGVNVSYEEWVGGDWVVISDESYPCVNGSVSQDLELDIDHAGQYRIKVTATDCVEVQECAYYLTSCAPLSITETSCHNFLISPSGNWHDGSDGPTGSIKITDLVSGTVMVDEELEWEDIPFSLTTNKDSLLLIEIQFGDQKFNQEVLDLCDLYACRKSLLTKLLCEKDPCKEGDCSEAISLLRSDANNANILMSEIERVTRTYRYRWLGVYDYGSEQMKDLSEVISLINMARLLSGRCGECDQSETTPCNNCSPV